MLKPPAPQHPRRRTLFFLRHPDHPQAAGWLKEVQAKLAKQANEEYVREIREGNSNITLEEITSKLSKKFLGREDIK